MRIVDRATFISLPAGTVFSVMETFGSLDRIEIKGDSIIHQTSDDYFYTGLSYTPSNWDSSEDIVEDIFEVTNRMIEGEEVFMDFDDESRDGCNGQSEMYCILNPDEVRKIIELLKAANLMVEGRE